MSFSGPNKQLGSYQENQQTDLQSAPPMNLHASGIQINFQPQCPTQNVPGHNTGNQAPPHPAYHAPPHPVQPGSYITPVQDRVVYASPPPVVPVLAQPANTAPLLPPARIGYHPGLTQPVAPPGYAYVYREEVDPVAVFMLICLFPCSLPYLFCMKKRYWELIPVGGQVLG